MALRFFDGFDIWTQAQLAQRWGTFTANVNDANGAPRVGAGHSFRIAAGTMKKTIDAQTTWIMGCAINLSVLAGGQYMAVYNGTSIAASVNIDNSGHLQLIGYSNTGIASVLSTGTLVLSPSTWYFIEFKITLASVVGNYVGAIRLNGFTQCSFSGGQSGTFSATSPGTTANIISIGNLALTVSLFDDFYACDGTGSDHNDFLGDVRVDSLTPIGAGNYTQWTPSTGLNWAAIDEITPNNDTDYVSTNVVGNIDSYVTSDLVTTPQIIHGVQSNIWARSDDVSTHVIHTLNRISNVDYESNDFTVTSSYAYYTNLMTNSPATLSIWTATEVNGMETGFKLIG